MAPLEIGQHDARDHSSVPNSRLRARQRPVALGIVPPGEPEPHVEYRSTPGEATKKPAAR
jgi:hypothetical protein